MGAPTACNSGCGLHHPRGWPFPAILQVLPTESQGLKKTGTPGRLAGLPPLMASIPDNDPTRLLADLDFVRSLSRQLCRDEHVAEDIAQDTLTAAIAKPPGTAGNWRGWLATVARNLARKHHRRERRLKDREARAASNQTAPSTDEIVQREQARTLVVQAVLALPERYRKVVLLRHYNSLDLTACAAALGVPPSTARTHLSRALQLLRKQLDDAHGGDRPGWLAALAPFAVPLPAALAPEVTTATALTTNKKIAAVVAAASLTLGTFAWTQSQLAAPTPAVPKTELAGANHHDAAETATDQGSHGPNAPDPTTRVAASAQTNGAWLATGIVTDDEDQPIQDAQVRLWGNVGESFNEDYRIPLGSVQTGSDGRFTASIAGLSTLTAIARSQVFVVCSADANGYRPDFAEAGLNAVLAGSDDGALEVALSKELLVKGRVVAPNGDPIPEAVVIQLTRDGTNSVATDRDGSFVLESPDPNESGTHLLIAQHQKYGRSQPVLLHADQLSETRVADLVLCDPGQRITGRVHYPDGNPVSDLDITIESLSDDPSRPRTFHGFEVEDYDELFFGGFHGSTEVETDAEGRFVYCYARPGMYEIDVDGDFRTRVEVRHGQATTHTEIEYDVKNHSAQLHVRLEDEQGRRLPEAFYGFHRWHGDAAAVAQARFASEGATPALMATASKHESMFDGDDEYIDAETDSFTIVESCFHDAGPVYGACRLQGNEHRGSVVLVLKRRTQTGSLMVDIRDEKGARLTPVWVRMCRIPTRSGLPIFLPGKVTRNLPPSNIAGPWHRVPTHGRLYDLPAGPLTVEVLAAPDSRSSVKQLCRYPVQTYDVAVPSGGTATIRDRAQEGSPLLIELRHPQLSPTERVANLRPMIGLTDARGGRTIWLNLHPVDGSPKPVFRNGRCLVRSRARFIHDTYTLRFHPDLDLQQYKVGKNSDGKWQTQNCKWRRVDARIKLTAASPPTVIQIERQ